MSAQTSPAEVAARPVAGRRRWLRPAGLVVDGAVVLGLLALALGLRWPALGPSSLWLDDAWVALVWRTEGWQELRDVGFAAPGFAAGLQVWLRLVGFSELQAQLPALVAGVLTPPAAYVLTRWRGWHRGGGVLAGVLLAVSPIAVTYATRVKSYTTEGLLAVVVLGLALWLADRPGERRRWVVFTTVGVVGTVVSAFVAPMVAAGVLAAFVAAVAGGDRDAAWRAVRFGAGYGALALLWYRLVLAPGVTTSISGFWSSDFVVVDAGPRALLASLRATHAALLAGWQPLGARTAALVLAVAVLALAVAARRQGRVATTRAGDLPVLVLLTTPLLLAVVLAALQLAPLGGGRTDLYLYPSLSLLVAAGVDALVRLVPPRGHAPAIVGALLAAGVIPLLLAAEPVGDYPRWDVRPLVGTVEATAGEDEVILVYPATMWAYALYTDGEVRLADDAGSSWGFAPRFADPRVVVLPRGRDDPLAYAPTVAQLAADDAPVVWLVASHWRDDLDDLRDQLDDAGFDGTEVARRDGARLERYERR